MKRLAAKDGSLRLRLIPPGKYKLPLLGGSLKKYPCIGYPSFWREMTEKERDQLYAIYLEKGLAALDDAVEYLDRTAWIDRYGDKRRASESRGRDLMEGR